MLVTLALAVGTLLAPAQADPSPTPTSRPPSTSLPADPRSPAPSNTPSPCTSPHCIRTPTTNPGKPEPTAEPTPTEPSSQGISAPGGISGWIAKGITSALNSFFRGIVDAALNPLLDLLGRTLLTTPSPSSLPRLGELWANSWQIAIACYALLVTAAGVVVMTYESVQTRYSLKEVAPRIPLGFLAAGLSLFLAGKAVDLANALSVAVMGGGVDTGTAGAALQAYVFAGLNANTGSVFFVLIGFAIAGTLVVLLVGYVVRLALTVILIAGAPLALMCHALPQTEGVARWWWKAFGGVLAIQIVQSLVLITGLRLFLTSGGFAVFGGGRSGLVDLLVALALFYILFKVPFWVLGSLRGGHGRRSVVGGLVRGYLTYRTFGALRGLTGRAGGRGTGGGAGPSPFSGGPAGPPNSPPPSGISPAAALRRTREAARLSQPTPSSAIARGPQRAARLPSYGPPAPGARAQAGGSARADGGPPPLPTFRSPGEPAATDSRPDAWRRPSHPPGTPAFRAPVFPARGLPARQPPGAGSTPTGPGARRPVPWPSIPPSVRPMRANRPPAPATFRPPIPENPSGARPLPQRPGPPPPTAFRAPPSALRPTPTPTPASSHPRRRLPPPPHTGGENP
ncbi:hypothetical protein [Streptomyces endophyticus]|uniref:Uncharacterized protein n=1 Tax=Streptomyces endophyticus TaxID=714166 RepID=A0ABU6F1Y9_9ACTN|nr:hypothetical protein [Streptomyces endophyticus]MEB8338020.1 hypothetical protein [Streptomyces endophyticus]